MKPGKHDKRHEILIAGEDLAQLKKFAWQMGESFGLDGKLERYQGKRPIGLYAWDIACIRDILAMALENRKVYPTQSGPEYEALQRLYGRIDRLYKEAYGNEA